MKVLPTVLVGMLLLGTALPWAPTELSAQEETERVRERDPAEGPRLLREAAEAERAGDLATAEARLREVLEIDPASRSALTALERILVREGRAEALLPALDEALAASPGLLFPAVARIRVLQERSLDEALAALDSLRERSGDHPELIAVTVDVAAGLRRSERTEEARALLAEVDGWPARMEELRLALSTTPTEEARRLVLELAARAPVGEETRALRLARLLGVASPDGRRLVLDLVLAEADGGIEALLGDLESRLPTLDPQEAPGILLLAAGTARTVGDVDRELLFLRTVASDHADASEAPEAALELARVLASAPDGRSEAISVLEAMVVRQGSSALAPRLRRELERMRGDQRGAGR